MREKELLKTLLNEPGCLLAPGVYDGLFPLLFCQVAACHFRALDYPMWA